MSAHTLIITNDFPPRAGGIQTFVYELATRFPPGEVTVLASSFPGDAAFDASQRFEVVRSPATVLLPTRSTYNLAREVIERTRATRVLFGAMAPLGLLASRLRPLGIDSIIAVSHGHEAGWAMTPGLRQALRRIGDACDRVTYISDYTQRKIAPALSPTAAAAMRRLSPGVDPACFTPERRSQAAALRREFGIGDAPVIVCVSRLMKRKGQDTLIEAMPAIRAAVPGALLVIVGRGSHGPALEAQVRSSGLGDAVLFTGEVPLADLPAWYAVGDVFAMPCRTRNLGWDVEGLGIVYLEASATGLPVVAGASGGAPDAVQEGRTGFVLDGRDVPALESTLIRLLVDSELRLRMGTAGRAWVEREWTWDATARRARDLLSGWDAR